MNKLFLTKLWIVGIMFALWGYFYHLLPNQVPIHWWVNGLPDAYSDRFINKFLLPILTLSLVLLCPLLAKIDPKKENYAKFWISWEKIQFTLIWFFSYVYGVILYLSFHPEISITGFLLFWFWVLFIILGNYLWKIRQNYFIGIKLPWTLANEEIWNKTHRFTGKLFVFFGVMILINSFFKIYPVISLIFCTISILMISILYSYKIYKK